MIPITPPEPPPERRVPEIPLPPYRFVPGLYPHPTGPGGHRLPLPERPLVFAYASDLFDLRYWWEAHEAWEHLWQPLPDGPERQLLQGLILAAASLFKRHVGHRDGARALHERAREKLLGVVGAEAARRLPIDELVRRLDAAAAGGPAPLLPWRHERP